jgi:hypothetical protein
MNGPLGKNITNSALPVTIYQAPVAVDYATVNLNMVNNGVNEAVVKVSITTSVTPATADYIETNAIIPANGGVYNNSFIIVGTGEKIVVESNSNDVIVRASGLEKLI